MSSAQDRIVLIATVVVESVWIYAVLSIFSLMMSLDGSPATWIASVVIMLVSFFVARTLAMIIMPPWMPYAIQMLMGLVVVYLTLGSQVQSAGQGFDLGWIGALVSGNNPDHYVRSVSIAGLSSALLWWRGGRLASVEFSVEHLTSTFRIGLIVLCFAAVVDIFHPADLKVFPLMFAFFAAGLVGLSIGHILPAVGGPHDRQTWVRTIGMVVGGVMIVGLLLSLLHRGVLTFISTPLKTILNALATAVFYVFILPAVYVIEFLVSGFFSLLARFISDRERVELETGAGIQEMFRELRDDAGPSEPSLWLQVLEWTLISVVVLVVMLVLARAFRRRMRWRRVDLEGERESFIDQVDPAMDMARLLYSLLPERFRRRKVDTRLRLPVDEADIVDVFRVYFGMLNAAESHGLPRRDEQTPTEYQSTLEAVFPQRLVRMATAAFNRACYGRRPSSREEVAEMREMLEGSEARR